MSSDVEKWLTERAGIDCRRWEMRLSPESCMSLQMKNPARCEGCDRVGIEAQPLPEPPPVRGGPITMDRSKRSRGRKKTPEDGSGFRELSEKFKDVDYAPAGGDLRHCKTSEDFQELAETGRLERRNTKRGTVLARGPEPLMPSHDGHRKGTGREGLDRDGGERPAPKRRQRRRAPRVRRDLPAGKGVESMLEDLRRLALVGSASARDLVRRLEG